MKNSSMVKIRMLAISFKVQGGMDNERALSTYDRLCDLVDCHIDHTAANDLVLSIVPNFNY